MAAFTSGVSSSFFNVSQDSPVFALVQELLVLAVFFGSFIAWREFRIRQRTSHVASKAKLMSIQKIESDVPHKPVCSPSPDRIGGVRQRQRCVQDAPAMPEALVKTTEQQLLHHLAQREFTLALNMYRGLERDGREPRFSEELYSAFIQSAIRVGKLDVVDRMLRAMRRLGVAPSVGFWQTTVRMLSSRKNFDACISIHVVFGRLLPADKIVYSCLINAALETDCLDRVAAMLDRYGEANLDLKDYVLFFRTYVSLNDADGAEAIFRKLGKRTTPLMLNLLLLTCVNTKQVSRALKLLREAHALEEEGVSKVVDVVSYNTLIKGFVASGSRQECLTCLQEMLEHGLEPDDITLGTLLDACITGNDKLTTHELADHIIKMDHTIDTVSCTVFIKALVRFGSLPQALEFYERISSRDDGCGLPDIATYSVLIKALVEHHDLDRAIRVAGDMTAAGVQIDDIILTHLIEGCRHTANHELGVKLFKESTAAGLKVSEFTLVAMLKLHGRCGAHQEAYDLVASCTQRYGVTPSVIHYTCLMSGGLRTKSYDHAWAAYELMRKNGIPPDDMTISTLLPAMIAAARWDSVLDLVRQALSATPPVVVAPGTLNSALSQLLSLGSSGRALADELQGLMRTANVSVAAHNLRKMLGGSC